LIMSRSRGDVPQLDLKFGIGFVPRNGGHLYHKALTESCLVQSINWYGNCLGQRAKESSVGTKKTGLVHQVQYPPIDSSEKTTPRA
jgi:hypothetical protein